MTDNATTQSATQTTEATSNAPVAEAVTSSNSQVSFLDLLDPEFKEMKTLASIKTVNDAAKRIVNAEQLIGKKVQDWAAQDLKSVYKKLGAPESVDGYQLPLEVNPEQAKVFKEIAFKAGLSTEQAKAFIDESIMRERSNVAEYEARVKNTKELWNQELKKEWIDDATIQKRSTIAERAIKDIGGEELSKVLSEANLSDHPAVKKAFAKLGTKFLYENDVVVSDKSQAFGVSVEDAQNMMNQKLLDPEFRKAYYSPVHPQHKAVVDEMDQLRQRAYANR